MLHDAHSPSEEYAAVDDDQRTEQRSAPRVSPPLFAGKLGAANFTAGEIQGTGQVVNISMSGALLSSTTHRLEAGTEVELAFMDAETGRLYRASGHVARATKSAFAVKFSRLERELSALVLDATQQAKPQK